MKIARFIRPGGGAASGVVEGDPSALTVAEIADHPFGQIVFTGQRWALPDVHLLSPILPSKVVGVGRNYADHAREMGSGVPAEPLLFIKPSTSVIGPDDAIRLPVQSKQVEHEAELAVVIGATGARNLPHDRALSAVFGFTCANDVTARDIQAADGQWSRAKGFDSFCPLGPWIDTAFDPTEADIECLVNGELRQKGNTRDLVHDIATLVSYVSYIMTLLPGDVILTGTPAGTEPLTAGDQVEVTISGLGTLTNSVKGASV